MTLITTTGEASAMPARAAAVAALRERITRQTVVTAVFLPALGRCFPADEAFGISEPAAWQQLGCSGEASYRYSQAYRDGYRDARSDVTGGWSHRDLSPARVTDGYADGYRRGWKWTSEHPLPVLAAV